MFYKYDVDYPLFQAHLSPLSLHSSNSAILVWFQGLCMVIFSRASLVAQLVKNLSTVQETWVKSLGWEDPLEKAMATHFSILACEIPWIQELGGLHFMQLQRVGYNWKQMLSPITLLLYICFVCLSFLCFLSREVPLAFVGELVWWFWIVLTLACLESFWFLL